MTEGEYLGKLFKDLKANEGISRAAFARDHKLPDGGIVNPSMIFQHITDRRPISLEYAYMYSQAFNVELKDISPTAYRAAQLATQTKNIVFPPAIVKVSDILAPDQQIAPTLNNDTLYAIQRLDEPSIKMLEEIIKHFVNCDKEHKDKMLFNAKAAEALYLSGQRTLESKDKLTSESNNNADSGKKETTEH